MAPKGGNAKKEGGRAKKAENEVSPPYDRQAELGFDEGAQSNIKTKVTRAND